MPEDSFESRLNGTSPVKIKKEGPGAWRAFTFVFALLFVVSAVGVVYFYDKFYKTEESYNKLAKQTNENASQQATQQNGTSGSQTSDIENPSLGLAGEDLDIAGLKTLVGDGAIMDFKKIAITHNGEFLVAIATVHTKTNDDPPRIAGGYAGVWYRSLTSVNDKGWKKLQSGQAFTYCSEYDQGTLNFINAYSYIDDDLDSKYIGCYEEDGKTIRGE